MKNKNLMFKFKLKEKRGFTLIEVIIAVSIVVILSSLAVPKVNAYIDKAKNAKIQGMGKQIYTAAMWSYADQGNTFDKVKVEEAIGDTIAGVTDYEVDDSYDGDGIKIKFSTDSVSCELIIDSEDNSYTINKNTDTD